MMIVLVAVVVGFFLLWLYYNHCQRQQQQVPTYSQQERRDDDIDWRRREVHRAIQATGDVGFNNDRANNSDREVFNFRLWESARKKHIFQVRNTLNLYYHYCGLRLYSFPGPDVSPICC